MPSHESNEKFAQIQRNKATGRKTVARAKLAATTMLSLVPRSKYSKRVKAHKSGSYRVRFNPADGLRLANTGRSPQRDGH